MTEEGGKKGGREENKDREEGGRKKGKEERHQRKESREVGIR